MNYLFSLYCTGVSEEAKFSDFLGMTFRNVRMNGHEEIIFQAQNGDYYVMHHSQECCEIVEVEDICGDLHDIPLDPIVQAEESQNSGELGEGTYTWTFYKLGTRRGSVTIRWYGSSNGYYSEEVSVSVYKYDQVSRVGRIEYERLPVQVA